MRRLGYQDSQMTTVLERLKRASEARGRYVATGEVVYEGAAGTQSVEQVREAMSKLTPGTLYLIMSGGKSDSDYMSREAYIKATAAPQKEYFIIEGASHIQTYYVPEYVDKAVGKLSEFFGKNL